MSVKKDRAPESEPERINELLLHLGYVYGGVSRKEVHGWFIRQGVSLDTMQSLKDALGEIHAALRENG